MRDIRLEKLAKLIVEYSTKVKKGDKVFIKGDECGIPFINAVAKEAIKKGAFVYPMVSIQEITEHKYNYGSEEQLLNPDRFFEVLADEADVCISVLSKKNTRNLTNIDAEKIKMNALANKKSRSKYMKRAGDGSLRWCITQFPVQADAQEASMSLNEYEDFVYSSCHISEDEDPVATWNKIQEYQEKWCQYLNGTKKIRIISKDTDITASVEGRTWENCCGFLNMPDGEVYTSPVENDINGHIRFSHPGIYNGKEIKNIYMEVEKGKVVKATADVGEELLQALLATDSGSSFFGELAIGTNYGITDFARNILFDEKIGGTVHMAIGNALLAAGGVNESAIHWDMLCDMKEGKVIADGEIIYENGHLIDSLLEK